MMPEALVKILIIEDNSSDIDSLQDLFAEIRTISFTWAIQESLLEAIHYLRHETVDVVLLDLMLPDSQGIATYEQLQAAAPNVPVLIVADAIHEQTALQAVYQGAQDYLIKNQLSSELLVRAIRYALEHKQLENALQESDARSHELEQWVNERTIQLAALNKELEAFSYSISHDLRAPLRAISGFSQILMDDYIEQLDSSAQNYFNRIRAAATHMNDLIDGLLGLSRLSRSPINRQSINLSQLAQEINAELRACQPERQVEFLVHADITCEADATLLRTVLKNLLDNAWKFTSRQASTSIEFGWMQEDGQTIYFVRDNGVGFQMAYAERLFGAFQRLHKPTDFEGVGIGLATVQRIIHRHGGHIWAEAEANQGATFYFTLEPGQIAERSISST